MILTWKTLAFLKVVGVSGSVAAGDDVCPRGVLAEASDAWGCHGCRGAASIQWVEARDAAEHPAMHGMSHTWKYLVQNNSRAEVENPHLNNI